MQNEQTLIAKSIKGDEEAQRSLYLIYRQRWYMLCMRYAKNKTESDDIMQEGLIEVYRDMKQYDSNRASFYTWSCRLMVNAALRYLKKNSWQNTFKDIEEAYHLETYDNVFDHLTAKEMTQIIQGLPTGYRIVFNMFALEGYSHKEIAKELAISEGTSKSQLSKAKALLRTQLEHHLMEYRDK